DRLIVLVEVTQRRAGNVGAVDDLAGLGDLVRRLDVLGEGGGGGGGGKAREQRHGDVLGETHVTHFILPVPRVETNPIWFHIGSRSQHACMWANPMSTIEAVI